MKPAPSFLYAIGFALLVLQSFAQASLPIEDECPAKPGMEATGSLGMQIGAQLSNRNARDSDILYMYQATIYENAKTDERWDSPAVLRKKVGHFWWTNHAALTTDNSEFNVPNGSVVKFGIKKMNEDFVVDVIETWKIPLNLVDAADGRTFLDYIQFELSKAEGNALEPILKRYYKRFRAAGAKHRAELNPNGPNDPPDAYDTEIKPLLAVWDKAGYYSEGLAAVKKDGKWGYVDPRHQIVVTPEYDGAFSFSGGLAAVNKDKKWGYIDAHGKPVIPLQYAGARVFRDGVAEVTDDGQTWFEIGPDGKRK